MTNTEAAPKRSRFSRWAYIFASVAVIIGGAATLAGAVVLPGCSNHDIIQSVREIMKETAGVTVEVLNPALVAEGEDDRTCSARVHVTEGAEETADITYRIFWDGWSKMVQIGEVQPVAAESASPQG